MVALLWKIVALLLGILLALFGIQVPGVPVVGGELGAVQGHWVDVNSDVELDISGHELTLDFGGWSETYAFDVVDDDGVTALENADGGYGFGPIYQIEVRDDGTLVAYEMVLDAEGHTYRFVREDALAGEREIRDLSTDLPKTIESRDIEWFSLSVCIGNGRWYGPYSKTWPSGRIYWEITKQDDGGYVMSYQHSGDMYIVASFEGTVEAGYVDGLAALIDELGVSEHNGYHFANNVDLPGYSLHVDYASGEEISIVAEGNAADTCVFDVDALISYAAEQGMYEGWLD